MTTFTNLKISNEIIKAMDKMGWVEPTPVQTKVIPVGLEGHDLFAQAQTGTGKTGTFGSIILSRIKAGAGSPSALVLVPTRELATQVSEELTMLAVFTGHKCIPIYGGVGIGPQISKLRRGVDIIVATPGRTKDLLERKDLDLSRISVVVLDEADRMLDMGFTRDIDHILSKVPKKRQTMMFSATMSKDIGKLAKTQMVDPKEILVSKDEPVLDLTTQYFVMVESSTKNDALTALLDKDQPKAIVFCNAKHRANRLVKRLITQGYKADTIHGNVAQNKRERVLRRFKDGSVHILVATDVAARGLDIDNVDLVVNFDVPKDTDTYVHRIGRTGRAGSEGTSVSLFLNEEKNMIRRIEVDTGKPIHPMDIETVSKSKNERPRTAIRGTHRSSPKGAGRSLEGQTSVEINFGVVDGMGKREIARMVEKGAQLSRREVGKITMGEKRTQVEILGKDVRQVSSDLSEGVYLGRQVEARMV